MIGCNIVGDGRWIFDGVGFYSGSDAFLVMMGCGFMVVEGCGCGCGGLCFMVV